MQSQCVIGFTFFFYFALVWQTQCQQSNINSLEVTLCGRVASLIQINGTTELSFEISIADPLGCKINSAAFATNRSNLTDCSVSTVSITKNGTSPAFEIELDRNISAIMLGLNEEGEYCFSGAGDMPLDAIGDKACFHPQEAMAKFLGTLCTGPKNDQICTKNWLLMTSGTCEAPDIRFLEAPPNASIPVASVSNKGTKTAASKTATVSLRVRMLSTHEAVDRRTCTGFGGSRKDPIRCIEEPAGFQDLPGVMYSPCGQTVAELRSERTSDIFKFNIGKHQGIVKASLDTTTNGKFQVCIDREVSGKGDFPEEAVCFMLREPISIFIGKTCTHKFCSFHNLLVAGGRCDAPKVFSLKKMESLPPRSGALATSFGRPGPSTSKPFETKWITCEGSFMFPSITDRDEQRGAESKDEEKNSKTKNDRKRKRKRRPSSDDDDPRIGGG